MRLKRRADSNVGLADVSGRRSSAVIESGFKPSAEVGIAYFLCLAITA